MRQIRQLSSHMADLIAAGEVVERPMSVVKELLENAIDSKSSNITVEIQNGGISYIRITDDGVGMSRNDAPVSFLRHATSKIYEKDDLLAIKTLGFRGEALAAISSVSKIDMFTKRAEDAVGCLVKVEAGKVLEISETGASNGTTIIVRDLFYNTPARMKFLKKDYTEASYITAIVENIALSHPEIAVKLIKDGKIIFKTLGDGELYGVIYNVLGKEETKDLLKVLPYEFSGFKVSGYISKPNASKATRAKQYFFVNGRFIKSKIISKAIETAYKNSIMHGKFPYGVLNIEVDEHKVDVNVHPTKTEIKFDNEKNLFDAIYFGCKETVENQNIIVEPKNLKPKLLEEKPVFIQQEIKKTPITNPFAKAVAENHKKSQPIFESTQNELMSFVPYNQSVEQTDFMFEMPTFEKEEILVEKPIFVEQIECEEGKVPQENEVIEKKVETIATPVKIIGECFNTYILCEFDDELILIDKHAAHERLKFNELLQNKYNIQSQVLLIPKIITLPAEEYGIFVENLDEINKLGFEIEDFLDKNIVVRQVPLILENQDVEEIITDISAKLVYNKKIEIDKIDDILHMIACKSAIKGNMYTSKEELEHLAKQVLFNEKVNFCPHGRPVKVALSKYNVEKMFKRIL